MGPILTVATCWLEVGRTERPADGPGRLRPSVVVWLKANDDPRTTWSIEGSRYDVATQPGARAAPR